MKLQADPTFDHLLLFVTVCLVDKYIQCTMVPYKFSAFYSKLKPEGFMPINDIMHVYCHFLTHCCWHCLWHIPIIIFWYYAVSHILIVALWQYTMSHILIVMFWHYAASHILIMLIVMFRHYAVRLTYLLSFCDILSSFHTMLYFYSRDVHNVDDTPQLPFPWLPWLLCWVCSLLPLHVVFNALFCESFFLYCHAIALFFEEQFLIFYHIHILNFKHNCSRNNI